MLGGLVIGAGVGLAGCTDPLERSAQDALREQVRAAQRTHLAALSEGEPIRLTAAPSDVEQELGPRLEQLDRTSGVQAYQDQPMQLGADLRGRDEVQLVEMGLDEAIRMAVRNNLDVRVAQLTPAIAETQITQAEAAFDAVVFADLTWADTQTPRPAGPVTGLGGDQTSEQLQARAGIRKPLTSGGLVQLDTTLTRLEQQPSVFAVDRYYEADLLLSLRQPLLRSFGSDVNRAEILLARTAHEAQVYQFRTQLLDTVFQVEQAYWQLVFARQQLLIQQRLLERTVAERDRVRARIDFDVSAVRLTEANSFVERRRAEVIRARSAVRSASDELKRLINDPDLTLADETLVLPTDRPIDEPIRFSLFDAVATALRQRPVLQAELLDIEDAAVRLRVADNARLPVLDLLAQVGASGLHTSRAGTAYEELLEFRYIDYLLGVDFEMPLGNRFARAGYRQRTLEQRQSMLDYRRAAQQTVLDVKNALRDVLTAYELIGATRAARRAAADSLRAIEEQEEAGVALTAEFLLDLKLQAQQRLAEAEAQEIDALTRYMTAIARLYQVQGTLLERHQIDFAQASDER